MKASYEEKRQLVRLTFSELTLDIGKLTAIYSKPFELLSDAGWATSSSEMINRVKFPRIIFEPLQTAENSDGNEFPHSNRPNWLPG